MNHLCETIETQQRHLEQLQDVEELTGHALEAMKTAAILLETMDTTSAYDVMGSMHDLGTLQVYATGIVDAASVWEKLGAYASPYPR